MERKHTDFPLYRESFEHDAGGILAYGIPKKKSRTTAAQPTLGKRKCITGSG